VSNLEKRTIILNTIFNFGSNLVSSFIGVYLYIYTGSLPVMCLYIMVRIGLFPLFFILGNKLSKKHSFMITYIFGLSLITLALIFALFGGPLFEISPYYVLIAAAIVGSGEGFYYFSANTVNQIVSTDETRTKFFSFNGLFSNITSLLSPVYASLMLSISKSEMNGYKNILITIIAIFIIVIFIAKGMKMKSKDKDSSLIKAINIKDDKLWRNHCYGVLFYGVRNGLELNTISLLVYNAAKGGSVYSNMQIIFSLITIISFRVIAKLLNKKNISRTFKIGVALKIISVSFLTFIPNMYGAIAYGVINALSLVFYDNSYNISSAEVISKYEGEMTSRVVAREIYLSFSRCLTMAIVILFYKILPESIYASAAVMTLTFACIGAEMMFQKCGQQS